MKIMRLAALAAAVLCLSIYLIFTSSSPASISKSTQFFIE